MIKPVSLVIAIEMVSISIAMATYNGSAFLKEQLDTLAAQHHLPSELQVGDDGSTDDTIAILEAFRRNAPFPVHIVRNERRLGVTENFMQTAHRCTGDWIGFCDQDDIWLPHKLSRCAQAVSRGPADLKMIVHNARIFFENGEPTFTKTLWSGVQLKPRMALPPHWCCAGFTVIFHRTLIELVPYETARTLSAGSLRDFHDAWVPMLANALGSILLIGEPLAAHRQHDSNTSTLVREPNSRLRLLRRVLRSHCEIYARDAIITEEIANLTEQVAAFAVKQEDKELLLDSSRRSRRLAAIYDKRASLYAVEGYLTRLKLVRDLLKAGGYDRFPKPGLGPRSLVKDLARALIGFPA